MYTLYFSPEACSLATHTILNMLDQPLELIAAGSTENFASINPNKMVPALKNQDQVFTEGAAIILHLLTAHKNDLLPESGQAHQKAIENMMMANATVHPAYGRLFFIDANVTDSDIKKELMDTSANAINELWKVVEQKIDKGPFLGGDRLSPADILLAVYSRWGAFFPVEIQIGSKAQTMINHVLQTKAFQMALQRETQEINKHAVS